jgi:antitoxin component of MazEF toxin-antitoxin module
METAVQRWGNSLALRIPRTYAVETGISEGSEVELTLKSGALVVRPIVSGVILADQIKSLDWKARRAEYASSRSDSVVNEVVSLVLPLIDADG